ncbi:endo-beta-N-acetylglucosaminidase [Streptococcus pneumoniae]|nr:endo-beta-N-acetylglucosaminidase [Streptococcus pneumoniae]
MKSRFESRRAYNSETESKRSGCFIERRQASSLSDSKTGVEVHFSNKEKTVIKGLKVERVQASAEEKKYFAGEDAHVFEIEGLDEKVKMLISLTLLL